MAITIGIDIGQKREPSALCVAESEKRPDGNQHPFHYLVRHLERLPTGESFPSVAKRAAEVARGVFARTGDSSEIYVDATGLGPPIVDLVNEAVSPSGWATPVYFNYGDRRQEEGAGRHGEVRLGKAYLVSRLQALLQTGRLHLPETDAARTLASELLEYEIQVEQDANDRYGAFRVGSQDDLVTALGLAVQSDPMPLGFI